MYKSGLIFLPFASLNTDRVPGSRRLWLQTGLLGVQVRPVRCRLPPISRLHALSVRFPRDPPIPRLRRGLSVQGERRRRVLRPVQTGTLRAHQGESRWMPSVLLFRDHRSLFHSQTLLLCGRFVWKIIRRYLSRSSSREAIFQLRYPRSVTKYQLHRREAGSKAIKLGLVEIYNVRGDQKKRKGHGFATSVEGRRMESNGDIEVFKKNACFENVLNEKLTTDKRRMIVNHKRNGN